MNNIVGVRTGEFPQKADGNRYLKIVSAGKGDIITLCRGGEELTIPEGGVAVIPPLLPFTLRGVSDGTVTLFIEQPLVALKEITVCPDVQGGGIRKAAEQAAAFFSKRNSAPVMSALGELAVSYVAMICGNYSRSPVVDILKEDIEKGAGDCSYTVEAAMRKLPLNYDYVRKLFKKETGLTPHEYLTSLRMERASKILLSGMSNRYSTVTISQIAEACGFAEPLYFSRVFKKYFGASPTEYCKNKR